MNASLAVGQFRRRSSLTNHSNRRSGNISARPVIGRFVTDLDTVQGRLRERHRSTLETVLFRRGKGCPGKLYRRDSESVQSRVAFCGRDRGGSSIYSQIAQVRRKVPFYRAAGAFVLDNYIGYKLQLATQCSKCNIKMHKVTYSRPRTYRHR